MSNIQQLLDIFAPVKNFLHKFVPITFRSLLEFTARCNSCLGAGCIVSSIVMHYSLGECIANTDQLENVIRLGL